MGEREDKLSTDRISDADRIETGGIGGSAEARSSTNRELLDAANAAAADEGIRFESQGDGTFQQFVDGSVAGVFSEAELEEAIEELPSYQPKTEYPREESQYRTKVESEPEGGGASEVSRLQIVRTAPPSYDPGTQGALTADDFFISFGLYNSIIPSNIDDKITIIGTATVHVWLEVTISTTNPAYASAVAINHGTTLPSNTPPPTGEWPETVYLYIGKIEDNDGTWEITNYGNGNAGGGVYVSAYNVDNDGIVTVGYGFSQARF